MSVNYRRLYKQHYKIEFGAEYVIHHIDGDRSNNAISNLLLLPRDLHGKYHAYLNQANMSINAYGGLCMELTFNDATVFNYQLSELNRVFEITKEIFPWIEYKMLADNGYSVYPMLARKEARRGNISQPNTTIHSYRARHNA